MAVFSSASDIDNATANCWSGTDTPPCLQMFESHAGATTLLSPCDSVPSVTSLSFGDELFRYCAKSCPTIPIKPQ